jgi:hypothetical protein
LLEQRACVSGALTNFWGDKRMRALYRWLGRNLIWAISVGTVALGSACSSQDLESAESVEGVGQVSLALASVPADALCLKVSVVGIKSVTRSFGLTPGQASQVVLTGLPLGKATLTADVFGVACASVLSNTQPTWSSYSMSVDITPVPSSSIIITLTRPGSLNANVDFVDNFDGKPCAAGQTLCAGTCVNTTNNAMNCGACGNICDVGTACKSSKCLLNDGHECVSASECVSGSCKVFFRDEDGDGHGVLSNVKSVCGSTAPPGFAATKDDCCDSGADAGSIFPGQTAFFSKPAVACNRGFDYNCSGTLEKEVSAVMSQCTKTSTTTCPAGVAWSSATVPECGVSANAQVCIDLGAALSFCASTQPLARLQACH